jgi:hypothetical protein
MSIRYRPMRPSDVRECMGIIAAHPLVPARYGTSLADLGPVWLRLLASEGFAAAAVVEEEAAGKTRIPAVGASVFLSDDFLRELKAHPHFWIGPELLRRMKRGPSPLLSAKQVCEANSRGGLNVAVWQGSLRVEDNQRTEVWSALTAAFLEYHRGFLLKEIVLQAESREHLLGMRNTGTFFWNAADRAYGALPEGNLDEIVTRPHVSGLTREMALEQPGSWGGSLFVLHRPPQFGFNRSEQRLLLAALDGGTDSQLSDRLGISVDAVRKSWRSIYARVAARPAKLIAANSPVAGDDGTAERGKEKKHHLLAYLHEHPEELRPVSRKLLNAAKSHS